LCKLGSCYNPINNLAYLKFKWRQISCQSWILCKIVPHNRQNLSEMTFILCLIGSKVHCIRKLLKARIHNLSGKMCTIYRSAFTKSEEVNQLRRLHDNVGLVPADKASNNIVFVCKDYHYGYFCESHAMLQRLKFFKIRNLLYILSTLFLRIRISLPHTRCCICFLDYDYVWHIVNFAILYLNYHTFIGFRNCIKISLYLFLLTKTLTAIKSLQRHCSTAYSRSGVNPMWILKNSKELLENLMSQGFF
jgi:hypothetical protein